MNVSSVRIAALFVFFGLVMGAGDVQAAPLHASSLGVSGIHQAIDTLRESNSSNVILVRERSGRRSIGGSRGRSSRWEFRDRSGSGNVRRYRRSPVRTFQRGSTRNYQSKRINRRRVRDDKIYQKRTYRPRRTLKRRTVKRRAVKRRTVKRRTVKRRTVKRRFARLPKRKYKKRSVRRYSSKRWRRSKRRKRGYRYRYRGWYYTYPWWLYVAALPYASYSDAHVEWCLNRYQSYDPRTNTYLGYDGFRHECISPYSY